MPCYMLCEPEDGVFMRNSMNSNVCMLYDKNGINTSCFKTRAAHPLSRESIAVSMIVEEIIVLLTLTEVTSF